MITAVLLSIEDAVTKEEIRPIVLNKRTDKIPLNAIYVGRPSKWGNPYKIGGKVLGLKKDKTLSRKDCIVMYHEWLLMEPDGKELLKDIGELRGKDLVCWCSPNECHADVLLELANAD